LVGALPHISLSIYPAFGSAQISAWWARSVLYSPTTSAPSRRIMMLVKEVMSDRVIRVAPDCNLKEIAIAMRDGDLGSIPVSEDDKLIGMVTDRDIVIRGLTGTVALHSMTARDVMSPSVKYCYEDQRLEEVLSNMASEQIRRLPVISRDKRLVGIVSLGDLAKESTRREAGEALEGIAKC
jgi:CBS domain-containing protein